MPDDTSATPALSQPPRVVARVPLQEVTHLDADPDAVSPLAWAVAEGMYDLDVLTAIREQAASLADGADNRFLGLNMLRGAHRSIPEIKDILLDSVRIGRLSEIAGIELERYPLDVMASHVNYYPGGRRSLAFHTDGAAMVEIVPLYGSLDDEGATLVFDGPASEGRTLLAAEGRDHIPEARVRTVRHAGGQSVLMQGRRLLHSAAATAHDRMVLVMPLRARDEPWKDDNTIARIAMDYPPEDFLEEWVEDELSRKLPAMRAAQTRASN